MVVHVDVTRVSVSVLALDHRERRHFEITVEWRGDDRWAVMHFGFALGRDGEWEYEPRPSSREDDWLESHRFGYDEALKLAKAAAPGLTVNGFRAADVAARGSS